MKNKLIRADSLLEQIKSPYAEYPIMIGIRNAIKEMIDEAPEIDAIPVEWLRDFQHFLYEEAEKISKEKDKNPMDTIGETWHFMSMSQAIDFTINKYGVENNLDKEIYGSEYIKMWGENGE